MVVLSEKFRFIRDDVFLCPWVDTDTGKQQLILQKINLKTNEVEFEDEIECIHTAITQISTEEFEDYQNDADTQKHMNKKILEIRSSEGLTEINLTPEEKFKAFKSWTAGITEAGLNAFRIQDEIDKSLDLLYPISQFLMKFMIKADSDFIQQYLAKIERDCMFEGFRHESSFIANSIPILEIILKNFLKYKEIKLEDRRTIKSLMAMEVSNKLFKSNINFLFLRILVEPDYVYKITEDETLSTIEIIWTNYMENNVIGSEEKEIIKALTLLDNSDNLFKSNIYFQFLRILVEPEYKLKISEDEAVSFLEIIWKNYSRYGRIEPQFERIIKYLITMDVSGKLFKSSSNFPILRIIVEPGHNISENEAVSIIQIIWKSYLRFKSFRSEDKRIIKALTAMDISDELIKNNLIFLLLRILVEPNCIGEIKINYGNYDLSNSFDEIEPLLHELLHRYVYNGSYRSEPPFGRTKIKPELKEFIKILAEMDVNDKISESNITFLFLRLIAEPNYIYSGVAEEDIEAVIDIILDSFFPDYPDGSPTPEVREIIKNLEEMGEWGKWERELEEMDEEF